jgi:hypothetical protein
MIGLPDIRARQIKTGRDEVAAVSAGTSDMNNAECRDIEAVAREK